MPYMKNGKRDYKKERAVEKANGDKRGKERAMRGKARREAGLKVGDGLTVDHKKELTKGGSNKKSNIRIVSAAVNNKKEADRKKREGIKKKKK